MTVRSTFLLVIMILILHHLAKAQNDLPILKSTSKILDIRDGIHLKKEYWVLMPERKPDYYYTELPMKDHQVSFISDIDSITFDVTSGKTIDFIVLWNTDSCFTRISATYRNISAYTEINPTIGPDTLPFNMHDNRIYFTGSMNKTEGIIFQFDTGAGMGNISYLSSEKAAVRFDGKTTLINTDGANEAPTSSSNLIEIAGIEWENVPFVQTRNMDDDEDAIIGNSFFQGKVIKIDYDHKHILLYDTLPSGLDGYSRQEVIYHEHRPHLKTDIIVDEKVYSDWFIFDTGWKGTMVLGEGFFRKNNVWDNLRPVPILSDKPVRVVPQLVIGDRVFADVLATAHQPDRKGTGRSNILGNELLNQFNVIIDNQNGLIYLKPNSLKNSPYKNWDSFKAKMTWTFLILFLVITATAFFIIKHKRRRASGIGLI